MDEPDIIDTPRARLLNRAAGEDANATLPELFIV
jgi:hypothetical protein